MDELQEGPQQWRRLSLQWVEAQQPGARQQEATEASAQGRSKAQHMRASSAGAELQQRALLPPAVAATPTDLQHWRWPKGEGHHMAPQYVNPFAEAAAAGFGEGSVGEQ